MPTSSGKSGSFRKWPNLIPHVLYQIDLFSLSGLLSHIRPRDILQRIFLLSILKLFIHHIHATIWKIESKNSHENHHMVWNGTTKRPSYKRLLSCVNRLFFPVVSSFTLCMMELFTFQKLSNIAIRKHVVFIVCNTVYILAGWDRQ